MSINYPSALQLLHDQVGVVNFGPYKSLFMQTLSRGRTCYLGLPSLPCLRSHPQRNWKVQMLTFLTRKCQLQLLLNTSL